MSTDAGDLVADSGVHGSRIQSGMTRLRCWLSNLSAHLETIAEAEREQLALWLPIGLMLGIGAWFWLADAPQWVAFLLAAGAVALAALALAGGTRWGRALLLFALAAALGCALIWWQAERVAAPRIAREQMVETVASIESVQAMASEGAKRVTISGVCGLALTR